MINDAVVEVRNNDFAFALSTRNNNNHVGAVMNETAEVGPGLR